MLSLFAFASFFTFVWTKSEKQRVKKCERAPNETEKIISLSRRALQHLRFRFSLSLSLRLFFITSCPPTCSSSLPSAPRRTQRYVRCRERQREIKGQLGAFLADAASALLSRPRILVSLPRRIREFLLYSTFLNTIFVFVVSAMHQNFRKRERRTRSIPFFSSARIGVGDALSSTSSRPLLASTSPLPSPPPPTHDTSQNRPSGPRR